MNPPAFSPPARDPAVQTAIDADHLKVLEIVFYVAGGMTALFSCIFIFHFVIFLVFGLNPQMFQNSSSHAHGEPPPAGIFLVFAVIIGCVILLGWTFGALQIYTGLCLRRRRRRIFVMVISAIECLFVPWGTLIGVFTLILLQRPSVAALFDRT